MTAQLGGRREFDGRPFIAGSLTGIRAFKVNRAGILTGVMHEQAFEPGVNDAVCRLGPYGDMMRRITESITGRPPGPHHLAGLGCQCGFYAYFKGKNSYMGAAGQVAGLIEGYGVCTVGSRGFRAEKARLVALVAPARKRLPHVRAVWAAYSRTVRSLVRPALASIPGVRDREPIISALQWTLGLAIMLSSVWFLGGWVGILPWLAGVSLTWTNHKPAAKIVAPPLSAAEFDAVRRNYPDVPVYRSRRAAVAAHPLTLPNEATS